MRVRTFCLLAPVTLALAGCPALLQDFTIGSGNDAGDGSGSDSSGGSSGAGVDAASEGGSESGSGACLCALVPTGWTAVELYVGAAPPGICNTAYGGAGWTGGQDLRADPATCTCSCATHCSVGVRTPQCGDPETRWPSGQCSSLGSPGQINVANPAAAPCTPQPTTTTPDAGWNHVARACAPRAPLLQESCPAGEVCAPAPDPSYRVCIRQDGDVACPYGTRSIEYASWGDARGCSPCTCGSPSACGGSFVECVDPACSSQCGGLGVSNCYAPTGGNYGMYVTSSSDGACQPSSVQPSGSATPQQPVTFCCL